MVIAHSSAAGHTITVVVITGGFVVHWAAWSRRPTTTIGPLLRSGAAALALVAATASPVEAMADRSFTGHMVQHLVLWVVVAPLLVSAHPIVAVRRAVGARAGIAGRPGLARLVRRHPTPVFAMAWTAAVATMYGTHLGPVYDAALRSQWLHELEHGGYLAGALLLWAALLDGPRSLSAHRVALAVATAVPMIMLGVILTTTDTAMYAVYRDRLGDAALADQRAGGAMMWLGLMAAFLPALVYATWRWAERDHRATVLRERSSLTPVSMEALTCPPVPPPSRSSASTSRPSPVPRSASPSA